MILNFILTLFKQPNLALQNSLIPFTHTGNAFGRVPCRCIRTHPLRCDLARSLLSWPVRTRPFIVGCDLTCSLGLKQQANYTTVEMKPFTCSSRNRLHVVHETVEFTKWNRLHFYVAYLRPSISLIVVAEKILRSICLTKFVSAWRSFLRLSHQRNRVRML